MNKEIVVYKKKSISKDKYPVANIPYKLRIWKPELLSILPPNKSIKYIFYWLFHQCGVFRNKNYSAYLLFDEKKLISSLLVVPKYFKWPFMSDNDVQFTYVMTDSNYKGQGLAGVLINQAMKNLSKKADSFWYVTDTKNKASMRVAEKLGFKNIGSAQRTKVLKNLYLIKKKF